MSFTEVTDGQGITLSSTASTTNDLHALGPNALAMDQQTHPGDSDYSILPTDRYVSTSVALTANRTWMLPPANSVTVGYQIRIADAFGACNLSTYITIPPAGTDTINLATRARVLNSPYAYIKVASNGVSNWTVIDQFPLAGTPVGDANYQMLSTDIYVYTTVALTTSRTWTLPAAASVSTGWEILVADQAGGCSVATPLTIIPAGTDTINGLTTNTQVVSYAYSFGRYRSDGVSNWQIVAWYPGNPLDVTGYSATNVDGVFYDLGIDRWFGAIRSQLSLANGRNDDVAGAGTVSYVKSPTAAFSISGIANVNLASSSHADNGHSQLLLLRNTTAFAMTLLHQDTNSTAFNRIVTPTAADVVVGAGGSALLVYEAHLNEARWHVENVYDGTVASTSPLTTKGDLFVYGTANTRLGVGTNGYALVADSTTATGLNWSSVSADGWESDTATWVYGSGTQFALTGNTASTYLPKGTKVSYNDGAVDYGHVASVSYLPASPNTSVVTTVATSLFTLIGHTLVNGYAVVPTGFVNTTGITNGSVKYVVGVTATTFQLSSTIGGSAITLGGTADTNVTITAASLIALITNADYSIANATLTAPRYSYADSPQGFPTWFNWSPTLAGWSANPTNTIYRYSVNGTAITLIIRQLTNGTSNNATHTGTAPVTAATITNMVWDNPCIAVDNGTTQTGVLSIGSGGTSVSLAGILATLNNTGSGNSRILAGELVYEF